MSDWSMWKPDSTSKRGAIEQMDAAGVTNMWLDTENAKNPEESLRVSFWLAETDGKPVVQIEGRGDFRVNVNDGVVFDRHTDSESLLYKTALTAYLNSVSLRVYEIPERLVGLIELREALIEAGFSPATVDANGLLPTYFGTSEDPAHVRADELVPGVYMDGDTFGVSFSVIVEKVVPQDDGKVWVTAYSSSAQRYPDRVFRADRPVETWGRV